MPDCSRREPSVKSRPRGSLAWGVLLSTLLPANSLAEASRPYAGLSLRQAIELGLQRNAALVEANYDEHRLQGAAEGMAGVLAENPILYSEAGVRRDSALPGNQTSISARIEQPLDLLGQAGSRRQAAVGKVKTARARRALVRVEVAARVHQRYLAAQIAIARRALAHQRLGTAMQTEGVLRFRVKLGAGSDIDLHMAAAETARARAEVAGAGIKVARAILDLRQTLGFPASADAWPGDDLLEPPKTWPTDQSQGVRFGQHPEVLVLQAKRLAIDDEITRLERERRPRLSLGLAMERPSSQERFLGLSLSIAPSLWRRNQGPLAEAHVERERAEFERGNAMASLERQWSALVETQRLGLEELRAVEETLSHEEKMRNLVREGWEAGKFDFLRVLLAERSLAEAKQARLGLWAELWSNTIEMNRLLGKEP
jgi:outer membrane protein, heavy metal efflux system